MAGTSVHAVRLGRGIIRHKTVVEVKYFRNFSSPVFKLLRTIYKNDVFRGLDNTLFHDTLVVSVNGARPARRLPIHLSSDTDLRHRRSPVTGEGWSSGIGM